MKVEILSEHLKKILSLAEKFSGKNTTLPSLAGILFSIEDKRVVIKATNLEIGFEAVIPAKTSEKGSFVAPGLILNNILNSLTVPTNISIEESKGNILFSTGSSKATIKCLPHEDFPSLPSAPKDNHFSIGVNDLMNGLKAVVYSAAISNTKPEISSTYIYPEGKVIVFVATDSIRLAEKKITTKKENDFIPFILPLKTATEVMRVCEATTDTSEVEIYHNENQVSFIFKNIQISSRLTTGNFPDYRQIIPKNFTAEAILLKQDFLGALKIANTFSDKFHKIFFSLQPKKKQLAIISENPDIGRNETIAEAALTGDALDISFNQKHIADCLVSIPQDSVVLGFAGESKPLVVRGAGDSSFTYLIAPLSS